jgi:uncharacterized membrane protein
MKSANKVIVIVFLLFFLLSLCTLLYCKERSIKEKLLFSLSKKGIHPYLSVFIISMLPIFELRGGVPVGINLFNMKWYVAVPIAVAGNIVPVLPILLLLGPLSRLLSKIEIFKRFFEWLFKRTRSRSVIIERYKSIGLMLFVSIPLPVTGAWTGSVAAFLFNIKKLNAIMSIFLGICIAAVVVTTLSLLGIWGAIIAGIALVALGILSLRRTIR